MVVSILVYADEYIIILDSHPTLRLPILVILAVIVLLGIVQSWELIRHIRRITKI